MIWRQKSFGLKGCGGQAQGAATLAAGEQAEPWECETNIERKA